MKKFMYSAFAVVAVLMAAVLTSCEKNEKEQMICTVATQATFLNNVSNETEVQINSTNNALNARAIEILGETFKLDIDDSQSSLKPTESSCENCRRRLENDDEFRSLVEQFHKYKTLDDGQAVYRVDVYFCCGTAIVYRWVISIVE